MTFYTLMAGKDSEIWQKGIRLYLELSCSKISDKSGDQTNTYLVTSSPDHTRMPLNLTKRTTTPSGLMQPEMKWIVSRNKRSSPHAKGQNGILTIKNPKCTSQPPKDQGKLDICSQVQWETQSKACCRWFSHPRTSREYLLRICFIKALKACDFPWRAQQP